MKKTQPNQYDPMRVKVDNFKTQLYLGFFVLILAALYHSCNVKPDYTNVDLATEHKMLYGHYPYPSVDNCQRCYEQKSE